MLESYMVTFSQVLVLFAFIAIGFGFKKWGKLSGEFNKGISNLIMYIFLPFLIFGSMANNFRLDVLADKAIVLMVSTGVMCFLLIIAFVFSRTFTKSPQTRDVYMYSFTFPNSGYFGNPLVLAIFGEVMLFDFIVYTIPFIILTYTFGIYILNPNRVFKLKSLINPIMVSMLLGMLVGALNIKIPVVVNNILDMGSGCMAPCAMILTGVVFASNNLKSMVANAKVYLACAIKMVIIPAIATLIFAYTNVPQDMAILMIITLTLPTGLNSIIFPEAYGGDSKTGAQLCFVSTLTCLIFMPAMLSLYYGICGMIH